VAEIVTDYGEIDASLEERDSATVPQHVRRDVLADQGRPFHGRQFHVFLQDIGNAVPRQPPSPLVAEQRSAVWRRDGRTKSFQCPGRLTPQRAVALSSSLATQAHSRRSFELNVLQAKGGCFANAGPSVVQEEQKRVITQACLRSAVRLAEDDAHVFWFEICGWTQPALLPSESQDPAVLHCMGGVTLD